MTSTGLMKLLVAEYVVIAVVCLVEGNWPRLLYWVCAAGLTVAILWGTR